MRTRWLMVPLFLLTACASTESVQAVDPATLPPLSGKEQALLAAAEGALRSGDPRSAERDYQEAVKFSTGHVEAHVSLATLYLHANEAEKAQTVLERGLALQPTHPQLNYLLGKLLITQNKPRDALEHFDAGLTRAPEDFDLLNGAGTAHDMLREPIKAQSAYKRAIALHPTENLTSVRTNLAMSYLLSNEAKKAVALLKPEVKKPGASAVTRHNLALAYGMLGKHSEAKALVSKDMTEEDRQMALKRLKAYQASPAPAAPLPAVTHN